MIATTDPAWEAMKAARSDISHNEAVQVVAFLQRKYYDLWGHQVPISPVDVNVVLRVLTDKKVPFVLTGTHGISGWTGRPRATLDVDILVKGGRNHARAVKVLKELYPQLEVRDFAGVTSFLLPGKKESLLDVTYPHRADIAETLAHPIWTVDKELGLRYRIPTLESALVNKYGAMNSVTRSLEKRLVDHSDFIFMVKHSEDEGRQPIDLARLAELGELANPGKGGEAILKLVEEAKSDRSDGS